MTWRSVSVRNVFHPAFALLMAGSMTALGCGDADESGTAVPPGVAATGAAAGAAAGTAAGTAGAPDSGELPPPVFGDDVVLADHDFLDSDANRDPFRTFSDEMASQVRAVPQRSVVMPETSVEEMRLLAIVTGISPPRVMLTDNTGVGHVVRRGDYLGRAEVVQVGGADGVPVTLNWRVSQIQQNEVTLTREDPTAPERPPLTRRIVMHELDETVAVGR